MSQSSPFDDLYQEELYVIPPRTLILLTRELTDFSEDQRNLLTKILSSVKLLPSQVQIIQRSDLTPEDLLPLNPLRIISFGVSIRPIQKQYECVPLDGVPVIISDSLEALDDVKKKNLWLAIKQMFGI